MNRKEVFTKANLLRYTYALSPSEALKKAWAWSKNVATMRAGVAEFYFNKVDGTKRQAWGTLDEAKLPELKGSGRKPNPLLQTYFDVEKGEFRCYKIVNLSV